MFSLCLAAWPDNNLLATIKIHVCRAADNTTRKPTSFGDSLLRMIAVAVAGKQIVGRPTQLIYISDIYLLINTEIQI